MQRCYEGSVQGGEALCVGTTACKSPPVLYPHGARQSFCRKRRELLRLSGETAPGAAKVSVGWA